MATKKKTTLTVKPRTVKIMFVHAFCWANGVIGFSIVPTMKTVEALPQGALPIGFAPMAQEEEFRRHVRTRAELSRTTDAYLVPGISSMSEAEQDIEAVVRFNRALKSSAPAGITYLAA